MKLSGPAWFSIRRREYQHHSHRGILLQFDAIPNRSGIHVVLDILTVPDDTGRSDSGRADAARRTDLTAAAGRTTAVPSTASTATAGPAAGRAADVARLDPGNATLARFCRRRHRNKTEKIPVVLGMMLIGGRLLLVRWPVGRHLNSR